MSGIFGSESGPVAETTTSAVRVRPPLISSFQRSRSASHTIFVTSHPSRMCGRSPKTSATCSRYPRMCRCPENVRGQSAYGAKENE